MFPVKCPCCGEKVYFEERIHKVENNDVLLIALYCICYKCQLSFESVHKLDNAIDVRNVESMRD